MEQEEFIHLALAEPSTKYGELQWRKIGNFIMNGAIQQNEANAQKPELFDGLQTWSFIEQNHKSSWVRGLELWVLLIGEEWGKDSKS